MTRTLQGRDRRGWVHIFRHRQVPGSDQRHSWRIPATPGWRPVPRQA